MRETKSSSPSSQRRRNLIGLFALAFLTPRSVLSGGNLAISADAAPVESANDVAMGLANPTMGYIQAAQKVLALSSAFFGSHDNISSLLTQDFELLTQAVKQLNSLQVAVAELIVEIQNVSEKTTNIIKDEYRDELLSQIQSASRQYALYLDSSKSDPSVFGDAGIRGQLSLILNSLADKRFQLQGWQGGLHPIAALAIPLSSALEFSLRARLKQPPATQIKMFQGYLDWISSLLADSNESLFGQIKQQKKIHEDALDKLTKVVRWKTHGEDWTWGEEFPLQEIASLSRSDSSTKENRGIDYCVSYRVYPLLRSNKRYEWVELWRGKRGNQLLFDPFINTWPDSACSVRCVSWLTHYSKLVLEPDEKTRVLFLKYVDAGTEFTKVDGNPAKLTGAFPDHAPACHGSFDGREGDARDEQEYRNKHKKAFTAEGLAELVTSNPNFKNYVEAEPDRRHLFLRLAEMNLARAEIGLRMRAIQVCMEVQKSIREQLQILEA